MRSQFAFVCHNIGDNACPEHARSPVAVRVGTVPRGACAVLRLKVGVFNLIVISVGRGGPLQCESDSQDPCSKRRVHSVFICRTSSTFEPLGRVISLRFGCIFLFNFFFCRFCFSTLVWPTFYLPLLSRASGARCWNGACSCSHCKMPRVFPCSKRWACVLVRVFFGKLFGLGYILCVLQLLQSSLHITHHTLAQVDRICRSFAQRE